MELNQSGIGGEQTEPGNRVVGGWMFPALLVVVLVLAAGVARLGLQGAYSTGVNTAPTEWLPTPRPQGEIVGLTIDFGNGATKQFDALPWSEGMTVENLMQKAAQYRPRITFTQQGRGETGFLQSLDGLKNQGRSSRNWGYEVNGRYAEVGFCVHKLAPGDHVLWKFAGRE